MEEREREGGEGKGLPCVRGEVSRASAAHVWASDVMLEQGCLASSQTFRGFAAAGPRLRMARRAARSGRRCRRSHPRDYPLEAGRRRRRP